MGAYCFATSGKSELQNFAVVNQLTDNNLVKNRYLMEKEAESEGLCNVPIALEKVEQGQRRKRTRPLRKGTIYISNMYIAELFIFLYAGKLNIKSESHCS